MSAYGKFHTDNQYCNFKNLVTGKIETKTDVFFKYKKEPEKLRRITAGTDPDYQHIDKPGCRNGQIIDKETFEEYWSGDLIKNKF